MKAPQGFSITIQDLVSQASREREQAEVILLSPLNYSPFLNIIKTLYNIIKKYYLKYIYF